MANSADGSIRIDTSMDNSGFEKGSEKLLAALKDLQNSVDAIGDTLGNGLDSVIKSLQALSTQATTTNQQITDTAQQAAAANQQVTQTAQEAAQATQAIAVGPQKVSSEYNSIGRAAASLHDQITRLNTAAEIGFKNDGQILRFRDSVDVVTRKTEELRNRLNALGSARIPTEDYKFLQSEVDKTEKALQRLLDRQQRMDDTGVKKSSKSYKNLQYDIDNARNAIATMKTEMSDMEAGGEAFTLGSDTVEYQNMSGVLAQLESELAGVQAESSAAQLALSSLAGAHPILAALAIAAQRAGSALLSIGRAVGSMAIHLFQSAVKALGNGLKAVATNAKKAVSGLLNFNKAAKSGINPVNALLRGLTSFKTMLISRIKRTFMSEIFGSLKEGVQQFALYSEEFNRAMSNIKNTGGQISAQVGALVANLVVAIEPVLTRLLSLINSVITAISALFAKLTGKGTVSVAVKQTTSYADSLKDAAGGASKAAKEQKKLNAELYGWDELTRQSKKEDTDTSGGGGASGPQWKEVPVDDILGDWEDIDWFQLGYDWAEKLADALDSIPWDKIQAAAYNLGKHFAELLNGVFANLHLADSLGKTIAEALNTGLCFALGFLETFDFTQFGVWAGTLWNAFVNAFDWDKLAKVITLGGNGIIAALTSFFQTIASTCEKLGGGIAKIFNAIFVGIDFGALSNAVLLGLHDFNLALKGFNDNIDWHGAAQNIINGVNTLVQGMVLDENGNLTNVWGENGTEVGRLIGGFVDGVYEVVSNLDYKSLGENIGLWLTNACSRIDWAKVAGSIVQGFNGVVNALGSLLGSINWYQVGTTIANALLDAIKQIDWAGVGRTLSNLLIGAFTLLSGFLAEMDWYALGESIFNGLVTMIVNINWLGILDSLGTALIALFTGAVNLLLGAIGGIFSGLADALQTVGADSIAGFFLGITTALGDVAAWLKEHIVDPVVNGMKALLGIASPSTVFAEIGNWMIQGLLQGITLAWTGITEFFSGVLTSLTGAVSGAWESIKMTTSTTWESIKMGITEKWNNIKTTVSTTVNNVKTAISTGWSAIKANTTSTYNAIKSTVQTNFNTAKTAVTTAVNTMKQNAVSGWQNMLTNAKTKFQEIYNTCKSKMDSVTSHLRGIQWGSIGSNLVNGLLNGLRSAWSSVMSWASSAAQSLTNTLKSAFSISSPSKEWARIGVFLDEGLEQGLENGQRSMLSTASTLAENLTDRMTDVNSSVQLTDDSDIDRLGIITSRLYNIASIIDHISEVITSMGGLEIPQIATGTVVPYRTKVSGSAADNTGNYVNDTYTAEAVQLLRNIRDYLASNNSGGNGDGIKVIIDGREVFNAVVNENNRIVRRTGGVSPLKV